jgi:AraC-like DNA-binding protein
MSLATLYAGKKNVAVSRRTPHQRIVPPSASWVMPAFLLRGVWDELHTRGVSLSELERRSGVPRPRGDEFSTTISDQEAYRLYEAAVALTGDEALGISIGSAMSVASLHLVGQLFVSSVSLRQAIELVVRAERHIRQRAPFVEDQPHGRVRLGSHQQRLSCGARVDAEMTGVFMCKLVAPFLEHPSEMLTVQFPFPAPEDTSAYDRVFPGHVEFDADGTFIAFPRAALDRRRTGVDPMLPKQLLQLAQDQYGTTLAEADSDWVQGVRRALHAHAAPRLVDPEILARQFRLSKRGLARRLAREGVSLSALIDEALYERARRLLRRPAATAKEIATALGYAELSSFFRAFRRWSGGLTPNEYRQREHATASGAARRRGAGHTAPPAR